MNIYETDRLLHEYLLFHYGRPEQILPWPDGPHNALGFAARTVMEMLGKPAAGRALDLGCAVGRSSYELSRTCGSVLGVDWSKNFVLAAERMGRGEPVPCGVRLEGHQSIVDSVQLPEGVHPDVVSFEQGDAMDLRPDLGAFDIVHAANLLCRLSDPAALLSRLPSLVKPGGVLILTTPCTWLAEFTPPAAWPQARTLDWLKSSLEQDFALEHQRDLPFLIREHERKFQWSVALGTRWKRR